jgi:hypothetical protein
MLSLLPCRSVLLCLLLASTALAQEHESWTGSGEGVDRYSAHSKLHVRVPSPGPKSISAPAPTLDC